MDYVCAILKVINLGLLWRQSTEIKDINISWQLLHKRNKKTLKYINTDTTFISNKKGIDCENGTKISVITNSEGVPLNIGCYKENKHDSIIFMDQIKNKKFIFFS